jgi:hypothetical protein
MATHARRPLHPRALRSRPLGEGRDAARHRDLGRDLFSEPARVRLFLPRDDGRRALGSRRPRRIVPLSRRLRGLPRADVARVLARRAARASCATALGSAPRPAQRAAVRLGGAPRRRGQPSRQRTHRRSGRGTRAFDASGLRASRRHRSRRGLRGVRALGGGPRLGLDGGPAAIHPSSSCARTCVAAGTPTAPSRTNGRVAAGW